MAGSAEAVLPLRFTTREVPVPSRPNALNELRGQGLLPLEPLPGGSPHVDLHKWRLPGAWILTGTFAGVRQGSDSGPSSADDELFFGINMSGSSLVGQRGHEVTIGAGDAVAIDPAAGAFSILRAAPARMIGVRIPRSSIPAGAVGFGATPLCLVPAETAALQLLTSYLQGALSGSALSSAPLADAVVSHVAELITLSLNPVCSATPPAGFPQRASSPAGRGQGRYPKAPHRRLAHCCHPRRPPPHISSLPAQTVRGRGNDLQPVRPGPAPCPRLSHAAPSPISHQDHQHLDRQRHRLR